jgi:hypothetical protein
VRVTIALLIVVLYVATQVWLAVLLVEWLDSFLGIAVAVLAATALLYIAGFFRRDLEERIIDELEQMLPQLRTEGRVAGGGWLSSGGRRR